MNDRAVVLCRTAAGMRAATWLAQRGVAVRVLCLEAELPTEEVAMVAGPREGLEAMLGPLDAAEPSLTVWHGGQVHPLPRRKRDLARMSSGGAGGLWGLLAARLHRGPTAEDWVRHWLGGPTWTDAVQGWLDHRLAGPSARAPAGVARRVLGGAARGGWWRPRWDGVARAEQRTGRILDAGGEVLVDVAVDGLDVEHGRIVGVRSEFGFEPVDGPLYTDLAPAELTALFDESDRPIAPHPPMGDRVRVDVEGRLSGHGMLVLDGARRLIQLARAHDGEGVVADVVLAPGEPLFDATDRQIGEAMRPRLGGLVDGLGSVRSVRREVRRITCPRPSAEAPWEVLVHRYAALGVQPVGETGWLLPVSIPDELALLEHAAAGAVVATQRQEWLRDGPPLEPWSPWVLA